MEQLSSKSFWKTMAWCSIGFIFNSSCIFLGGWWPLYVKWKDRLVPRLKCIFQKIHFNQWTKTYFFLSYKIRCVHNPINVYKKILMMAISFHFSTTQHPVHLHHVTISQTKHICVLNVRCVSLWSVVWRTMKTLWSAWKGSQWQSIREHELIFYHLLQYQITAHALSSVEKNHQRYLSVPNKQQKLGYLKCEKKYINI